MIRYSLSCDQGHGFDAWFSSSADFDRQAEAGYVSCPHCGSSAVAKQLMAPTVATAREREARQAVAMDAQRGEMIAKLREMVKTVRENSEDVGERFPEEARKIHYGESDPRGLIGRASPDEARALIDEGIEIAPLPVLPDDVN
ncbi:hypothetical protein BJF93_01575 [Xaviernesmea oryzae]|uniref:DUF1178 family protein n=1 Tax=Xaviernesmea oryzae TaxID=464029 RepID=A0A1Q9B2A8_9HYPH|nr:DUF1178 family protein [Xaviernesmea oryzae]OLP62159.1 hypothetical protein BJF93_01575 [Xaviernesmea oryzae]SEL89357.1 hypothetical protein SAMN04487976_114122 [Xaviernesmea oryzae]